METVSGRDVGDGGALLDVDVVAHVEEDGITTGAGTGDENADASTVWWASLCFISSLPVFDSPPAPSTGGEVVQG